MKLFIILLLTSYVVIAFDLKSRISFKWDKENIESYIFGGRNAENGEAPWQAAIQDTVGILMCGGSIVSSEWVVTTETCVHNKQPKYTFDLFYSLL